MDKWEQMKANLKRLEEDPNVDQELLKTMDTLSLADYWKRRAEEAHALTLRLRKQLEEKEQQSKDEKLRTEMMERSFEDKRRLWDQAREAIEEKIKVKEMEVKLLRERADWENRFKEAVQEFDDDRPGSGRQRSRLDTDEYVLHELRRLTKEFLSLRDSTDQFEKSKQEMQHEKERLIDLLKKKTTPGFDFALDINQINETLKKMSHHMDTMENDLIDKLSNVQPKQTPSGSDSNKDELVIGGALGGTSTFSNQFWKERIQATHLAYEESARGFSHKARNLLGIISGTAQIAVSDEKLSPGLKEQFDTIDKNVTFLLQAIEEYLQLTRHPEINLDDVDINSFLKDLGGGSSFQFSLEQNLPRLRMDKKLIREGFDAALENAREAGQQGDPIHIKSKFDKENKSIIISFTDHGKGIGENHLRKVFQPYFSTKKEKRGLGLSMAQRALSHHGGKITIESDKGKGTTINFHIPLMFK